MQKCRMKFKNDNGEEVVGVFEVDSCNGELKEHLVDNAKQQGTEVVKRAYQVRCPGRNELIFIPKEDVLDIEWL